MLKDFKCQYCGAVEQKEIYPRINTSIESELKDKIKDASLFLWDCPCCGKANLLKYNSLYHDPEEKIMLWLLTDTKDFDFNLLKQLSSHLSDYRLRLCPNISSLIEKIKIFDAQLDDLVVEMCKYVTKQELAEKLTNPQEAKEILDAPMQFYSFDGADSEIVFSFPLGNEIKQVNIGLNVYEDCRLIVARNPEMSANKDFICLDQNYLMKFFA